MRVAAIQHDIAWCDRETNFAQLEPLVAQAAQSGARLVVLTETFSTGFAVENADAAEPAGGPTYQFLARMATEHNIWITGSCLEASSNEDSRMVNALIAISPTGAARRYHKIHPFTFGGEAEHVQPGTEHVTIDIDGVRTSLFICYDLRFADEFWRLAPSTDLYIVPANWPSKRQTHWGALLRARAIENQAYVIGCNRVGTGPAGQYMGESMIIDPWGASLAVGGASTEVIYADIVPNVVANTRAKFPFLNDRR